jgi:hypothetical protein
VLGISCKHILTYTCLVTAYTVQIQLKATMSADHHLFHEAVDVGEQKKATVSLPSRIPVTNIGQGHPVIMIDCFARAQWRKTQTGPRKLSEGLSGTCSRGSASYSSRVECCEFTKTMPTGSEVWQDISCLKFSCRQILPWHEHEGLISSRIRVSYCFDG